MNKDNQKNLKTNVNEDLLKFLKFSYFGALTNLKEAAANRAYRDMCRTIRFNSLCEETRLELKKEVNRELITKIETIKENFEIWHKEACGLIIEKYEKHRIELTYGQAQKWVNMTIKYLYMLNEHTFDNIFEFLHIPIDNYIFKAVKEKLGIDAPTNAWSRWDNYDEYLKYQNDIREKICTAPLRWEFENWLDVAQNKN